MTFITVSNRRSPLNLPTYYVGRPSPLGNPYSIRGSNTRDIVIAKYKKWLYRQIQNNNPQVLRALNKLYIEYKKNPIALECWCSPKACHADVIKEVVENMTGLFPIPEVDNEY